MTKKDLFRVLIKLFGLYASITLLFYHLPDLLANLFFGFDYPDSFYAIIFAFALISLFVLLMYNGDKIIAWLKLDQGYDDDRIDFKGLTILQIANFAIVVIGGLLIIDNLTILLEQSYYFIQENISNDADYGLLDIFSQSQFSQLLFFTSLIKIIVGYLFLTNFTRISSWLVKVEASNKN